MATTPIPTIDLAGAMEPGGARSAQAAEQMRAAAMSSGFFYVRGHGIAPMLVQRMFSTAQTFFDLPAQAKHDISLHRSPTMRGYEGLGDQRLDAAAKPDLKESFYCGIEYPDDHPYVLKGHHSYGHNQWPDDLPTMSTQCGRYIDAMLGLCQRLMQLMAISLDLPEGYFDHTHANPMATLRLLRYPPQPAQADEQTFGAGAHTDWGAITVLAQDHHGGLEVCMPDGSWAAAPPVAGSFVVNLGDMIPRWTNGRYHSNPHRVRNLHSGGHARHSIPFFYSPDYEARVVPVETCIGPDAPPRFDACTVGEHLRQMYARTYEHTRGSVAGRPMA